MRGDQGRPDRLITIKEVQSLIGVSHVTIYAWMAKGDFPCGMHLSPQVRRWWRSEVLEWLASRNASGKKSPGDLEQPR